MWQVAWMLGAVGSHSCRSVVAELVNQLGCCYRWWFRCLGHMRIQAHSFGVASYLQEAEGYKQVESEAVEVTDMG